MPHCGKYFNILMLSHSLPHDVYEWTMDLRYCWGRQREASSDFILRACDILEKQILSKREALSTHILSLRADANPHEVCQELLQSINMMRGHAEKVERCQWTMKPRDGEVEAALKHCLALLHDMERSQQFQILTREQESQLLGASDSIKINFVNSFTDGLSGDDTA
jgi:hypothetical protein